MRIGQTLRPGQRGTKRLSAQYGEQLICVRYRYDAQAKCRYTTVELIVDTAPWNPPPPSPDTIVALRVVWGEREIALRIKAAGGQWNGEHRVWEIAYKHAEALNLLDRIVPELL